jgi:hypothetical protein
MGLFSFLFRKKSKTDDVTTEQPGDAPAHTPIALPTAPSGRPDRAPQPIGAEPVEQNPIAAAMDPFPQAGVPAGAEPVTPVMNPVSASLQAPAMPARSAEEMCEIDAATMDRDAIRAHLAALYRRHNAAAASLDAELRAEAELMLDAIVACREKYIEAS